MSSRQQDVVLPTQATIKCDGCDDVFDVKWFCKSCPASLCNTCKHRHETDRFLSKHTVSERTGSVIRAFDSSKIKEPCPKHPESEITVYCNDCGAACCMTCVEENHQRHAIVTIEKKYMESEDKLNALVDDIEKNTLKRLRENIDDLRKALGDSERKFADVETKVNTFRTELKNAVDKSCDNLVDELKEIESKRNKEMQTIISDLEDQIKQNKSFISMCGEKVRKGGLYVLQYSPRPPAACVRSVDSLLQNNPVFVPANGILEMISKRIGEVQLNPLQLTSGMLKSASNPTIAENIGKSLNINVCVVNKLEYKHVANLVCPVGQNKAWICQWFNEVLHLYKDNGKELQSVKIAKDVSIKDMKARSSGEAIVCCNDSKVRLVTMKGKVSTLIDTSPFIPKAVCLTESEGIVVSMTGQDDRNHVAVYTPDGKKKIQEIQCKDKKWNCKMTKSTDLVMNGTDITFVADSAVVTCSQDGKIRWEYDGSQASISQGFDPYGICVDRFHNLFISDYDNNCVHYVDREGDLIQILLTREQHGIERPWGVCVDVTGRVWVGSNTNSILIAEYLT